MWYCLCPSHPSHCFCWHKSGVMLTGSWSVTLVGPSARCRQRQNLALPNVRRGTLHPSREKERNIFSSFFYHFSIFFIFFIFFQFFHFLSFSFIFFHFLSFSFIFFHLSFIFFYFCFIFVSFLFHLSFICLSFFFHFSFIFLSFSFIFFHCLSFSFSLLGAQILIFFGPQFRYDFS